mmetsp:Transcript_38027/g.82676  ORF Transcript_38027/g.82676 Transcript_38027/m.82676 type:complete len:312 (-) Transcript_38027:193-1128(-)
MADLQAQISLQRARGCSFGARREIANHPTDVPGPGTYDQNLPPDAPRVPSFKHRPSPLDLPTNFSTGACTNSSAFSPRSQLSPSHLSPTKQPMLSPHKGSPKPRVLGRISTLSPTSAISPSALVTPNTARSITVNCHGSQSPFLLGANATCASLQNCVGAHVTAGPGSTYGNRTRHSCFTRGVSEFSRDTTLHPTHGGRSIHDRLIDDHTLGPGHYGEVCDMNQALFGPAAVPVKRKKGKVLVEARAPGKHSTPQPRISPVRRHEALRPDNLEKVPPVGTYTNVRCDVHTRTPASYTFGLKLPSLVYATCA